MLEHFKDKFRVQWKSLIKTLLHKKRGQLIFQQSTKLFPSFKYNDKLFLMCKMVVLVWLAGAVGKPLSICSIIRYIYLSPNATIPRQYLPHCQLGQRKGDSSDIGWSVIKALCIYATVAVLMLRTFLHISEDSNFNSYSALCNIPEVRLICFSTVK
jgi:hypothetical protein